MGFCHVACITIFVVAVDLLGPVCSLGFGQGVEW